MNKERYIRVWIAVMSGMSKPDVKRGDRVL